ncbi:Cytosol aminopeptidase, catalytic domain [Parelaphostrongylus tenuis]|uniref:Cytosol aminopeptidase, catalytic domain n=1 Tax=Parelaphostrongylus tenuis TaxID=148309 RepID=A0AAD5WFY4_PARTN|nr:Cytosol aminopeptidase, catalytic domain [Parelaphostrongylus tenuis]
MTPPRVADYVKSVFGDGSVKVEVTENQETIKKEYPLMAAVNRCANTVKEHQARLIRLEYCGEGTIENTYFMIGKGVTIDTGGHMWGMCRDKYGSAIVAGFFKALDILRPKNIKAIGYMCMVRNSIGSHAYTCDEVITSRSGRRIHIYNTDAEGRLTILDPLTRAKEEALRETNPHLMTIATLTGHEVMTYGYYATFMDNGPAKRSGWARRIQDIGDVYGQPIEISRLQPEDFAFHKAECEQAHLRQGATKPSTQTIRGHQSPGAFLIMGSRLDEHGCDSNHPLKFTHIDMGAAPGEHPETSFPNPLVTLMADLILSKDQY